MTPESASRSTGRTLVITGAGAKEIRLKPGSYTVEASKDGKVVSQELVTVTKNGRQVVRVSQEAHREHRRPYADAAQVAASPPTRLPGSVSWPPCRRSSR